MDFKMILSVLFFLFNLTHAGVIPAINVLQGPSSKTVLLGPDGSSIDSVAPGGTVVIDEQSPGLIAAPAQVPLGPELVVSGPAGSIITSYTNAGPAAVPIEIPAAVASASIPPPTAEEGAYVPDNTEALYDDGSYKGDS
ncbi:unnamed protein product [Phyllotreta striolata]|uniref:Uncharacterized protein n=1 Tax=Phyllotreta striolata TaxID=444603 RepID=A0A9N9TYA5_PHYSR|nr:unnamed protein product [Phyllotreta striolata]